MRRFVLLLIMLVSVLFVLSAEDSVDEIRTLSSESKTITAFKNEVSEDVPGQSITLRMLNVNKADFFEDATVSIPIDARDNDYPAFYWVMAGNIYGELEIEFTFYPMWQNNDSETGYYIPYTLKFAHQTSKVGNAPIAVNKASTSLPVSYLGYDFYYADSVALSSDSAISVSDSEQTASVTYDIRTNTTVEKDGSPVNDYPNDVCSTWNRIGLATLHMEIDADGKTTVGSVSQLPDGIYYSTIRVEVTPGT